MKVGLRGDARVFYGGAFWNRCHQKFPAVSSASHADVLLRGVDLSTFTCASYRIAELRNAHANVTLSAGV
jgi:hypothetical protein